MKPIKQEIKVRLDWLMFDTLIEKGEVNVSLVLKKYIPNNSFVKVITTRPYEPNDTVEEVIGKFFLIESTFSVDNSQYVSKCKIIYRIKPLLYTHVKLL